MLICQCKWLTYNQLCEVIDSGAGSLQALQQSCGAGTECGGCVGTLQQLLEARRCEAASRSCLDGQEATRVDIDAA